MGRNVLLLKIVLALIETAHLFGHFGQKAMFMKLFEDGWWWPDMRKDIEVVLSSVILVIVIILSNVVIIHLVQLLHLYLVIIFKLIVVHIYLFHIWSYDLLVVIDVFTGFVILRPCRDTTATTIARKLWKIFTIIGLPRVLQSDNGPEFVNEIMISIS